MIIREIDGQTFDEFALSHPLKSHYQTSCYGQLMRTEGYESFYIGAFINDKIVAASLIIAKYIITTVKYGYAPCGFLIDYYNTDLLKEFTIKIKEYFSKRKFAFIKINPEITYALINPKTNEKTLNRNNALIIDTLKSFGYKKLKDNLYFERMKPKFNPIININNYDFSSLTESLKDKLINVDNYSLIVEKSPIDDINKFYELIKDKTDKPVNFYKYYYKYFNDKHMIDLFLLKLDKTAYMAKLQRNHNTEYEVNVQINNEFSINPNNVELYKLKIESDKRLESIKANIIRMSNLLNSKRNSDILGGALVTKVNNRITIVISGYNKMYENIFPEELLYYKIIDLYKSNYKFFDLGGITGDFSSDNPYAKLNEFKLSFKPSVFEYIGEFDLVVNPLLFKVLFTSNRVSKEFKKEFNDV